MTSNRRAGVAVFAGAFLVALAGDACHVASGTTRYLWDLPEVWDSALWFPFAVAAPVTAVAWLGRRLDLPRSRPRGVGDGLAGLALVLALYALTATLVDQPTTVSVVLCAALAVAVWAWWDPSPASLAFALGAAVAGPAAELGIVAVGAAEYGPRVDGLFGVAPWLPCLYFAAGAVASGLWRAFEDGGR